MITRGSEWRRWEPHIHTPGTLLNNQFGDKDPWADYFAALRALSPQVVALGITDYYVTDSYEEFLRRSGSEPLPDINLVFPNIELRLDVAAKSGFVNLHLLVSPEDPNHLEEVRRLLKRLQFRAYDDTFTCSRDELIKLGKLSDPSISDDRAALAMGATQFKANFGQLRKIFEQSEWAKQNVLVAVAGNSGDGTSGVRLAADRTVRQEIESFAHIIFSSSPAQREFWIGNHPTVSKADLLGRYNGCKPCLHGSDAHQLDAVGIPTDSRYSWVKGAVEFDSLRQACIDPEHRAYVGERPPAAAMPSQAIDTVRVSGADWITTPEIPLNPGLVAIVGARGSGKTALADIIAAGCDALPVPSSDVDASASFLARAQEFVGGAITTLTWGGGTVSSRRLDGTDHDLEVTFPRARYLSQQFVEELCSGRDITDGLINEIERVIFEAHEESETEWAADFDELREQRIARFRQARARHTQAVDDLSDNISTEFDLERIRPALKTQVDAKKKLIDGYISDRSKLVVKGTKAQIARHAELSERSQVLKRKIQTLSAQRRTFIALGDEVESTRLTEAPEMLRQAQARHHGSGLTDKQWDEFLLVYKGDVDESLRSYVKWADGEIKKLTGVPPSPPTSGGAFFDDKVNISELPLSLLTAEIARLEELFGADKVVRDKYTALTARISQETSALRSLEKRLGEAEGAPVRRRELQKQRNETYRLVFEAIINEQVALADLYAPLMARLGASSGTLKKLSISVRRIADVEKWSSFAEEHLLDRRKSGTFYGRGGLTKVAKDCLQPAWETGQANDVQRAMSDFMTKYMKELMDHIPKGQSEAKPWLKNLAHWLFGTEHIAVRYEILYDGVNIRHLSPGTRGIVLLLLYLALDTADDRPLIIDQPEENLDPKSVFDELVGLFIQAKSKRQVIIVTHNANLVINTDADQIIVAEAGLTCPRLFGPTVS